MTAAANTEQDFDEHDDFEGEEGATAADQNGGGDVDESVPEGFESQDGDLVAYWEPASQGTAKSPPRPGSPAILFTPLYATLSDSKIKPNRGEQHKSSTLIHCRLERACRLRSAVKSEGYKVFEAGSLIGIWSKPGMRRLQNLAGVPVYMKNSGFKDVGNQSDMVTFDIKWKTDGQRLKVQEDRRNLSLTEKERAARASAAAEKLDDIPF